MLCSESKAIIFTSFALGMLLFVTETDANNSSLGNIVKNLVTNMEQSTVWDENLHFSLIFAEFVIKRMSFSKSGNLAFQIKSN